MQHCDTNVIVNKTIYLGMYRYMTMPLMRCKLLDAYIIPYSARATLFAVNQMPQFVAAPFADVW